VKPLRGRSPVVELRDIGPRYATVSAVIADDDESFRERGTSWALVATGSLMQLEVGDWVYCKALAPGGPYVVSGPIGGRARKRPLRRHY
jgi:hypothetical protein